MSLLHAPTSHTRFLRICFALGLSVSLAGCVAFAGGGKEDDVGGGAVGDGDGDAPGDGDGDAPTDDEAKRERCREATSGAKAFLTSDCASCHGSATAEGGSFATVLDINAMIDDGIIVPGQPEKSKLYTVLDSKVMPPASVTDRPSDQNVDDVRDWIACGAPALARDADAPEFIDIDERLETMLEDLKSFDAEDRTDVRYLDLYELANAGYSEAELDVYRQALSYLMNSLSHGLRVVPPQRVDDRGLLFRIELNDYAWTEETWAEIASEYPYAVQYDENSELFPFDEDTNERIRKETGEPIAYVHADWFVSNAARPPLYNRLLGLPDTLNGLAEQLGIDIQANIDSAEAVRVGFRQAASSQYDRVMERHEQPGSAGSLWISYDFNSGVGTSDVFAHPLDFVPAGMQAMFNLENGMLGYMVFDAQGQAIAKAPTDIVQDPHARDGAAETGISCLGCHVDGPTAHVDEVREAVRATASDIETLEKTLALYPPQAEIDALFAEDLEIYSAAREASLSSAIKPDTIHEMDDRHLDVLNLREVAAVLGVTENDLRRGVDASPQRLPASVRALRNDGTVMRRDALEADFAELVVGLNLGTPYDREDLIAGGGGDDDSGDGDTGEDPEEPPVEEPTESDAGSEEPSESDGGTAEPPPDGDDGSDNPYYP